MEGGAWRSEDTEANSFNTLCAVWLGADDFTDVHCSKGACSLLKATDPLSSLRRARLSIDASLRAAESGCRRFAGCMKNFRLLRLAFRLGLSAAFSRMIAQVRLFEAVGVDVSINLRG
jgi:hypothetical protein